MLIKMISTIAGPDISASAGQEVELDNDRAVELVTNGYAVAVKQIAIEQAATQPAETAIAVDDPKPFNKGRRK